MVYVNAP